MRWVKALLFWGVVLAIQASLMGLSHWQWNRLAWKEHAMTQRDMRWSSPVMIIDQALFSQSIPPDWHHVRVCGHVIPQRYAKVSYVAGLPKSAFSLVVPMRLDGGSLDNRNVFLDVGYFYFDEEMTLPIADYPEKQCVTGHILPAGRAMAWGMGGEGQGDVYSYFDIDTIARRWSLDAVVPWVVRLDQPLPQSQSALKAYPNTPPELRNPHRGYALTWMALAVIWPVMVWLRIRKGR
ncbi:MAG: SURF1 family protein [Alphaproteobacteria bacterium]